MRDFRKDQWLRHIWEFKGTVVTESEREIVIKDAPPGTYKELLALNRRYHIGLFPDVNPIHIMPGPDTFHLIQLKLAEVTPADLGYECHPAANLFPMLSGKPFDDLVADIKAQGLHTPIVLHRGKVLDGRNRLLACHKAGVEPRFTEWDGTGNSPTARVISLNLQRRHLDAGQRAMVAVDAKPLLEGEAKVNQKLGGDASTFLNNEKPRVAAPLHVDKTVAEQFNVSSGYVHAAQKVKDASPELAEQVKAGKVTIPEAQRALGIVKPPVVKLSYAQRLKEITEELATLDVPGLNLEEMKELFQQLHVSSRAFASFGQAPEQTGRKRA